MLRYVGNRMTPEPVLYDPVERLVTEIIPPETIALTVGDLQKFAESVSNPLFSDMTKDKQSGLFLPTQPKKGTWAAVNRSAFPGWMRNEVEPKPDPPEEPFEVNLTTPLIGYRAWNIHAGLLVSLNDPQDWTPDNPMKAHCLAAKHCKPCPSEHCTCGIYAVDELKDIQWGSVFGKVYGWGRYVRGENGWRSQFAYPAEFYLATQHDRETYVWILKKYHVPISQFMPIQVYHPSEDGYENWQDQEDRNLGASRDSDAEED